MPSRNRHLGRGQSWPVTLTEVMDGLSDAYTLVQSPRFESGTVAEVVLTVRWAPSRSFNYGTGGRHPDMVGIQISICPIRSADRVAVRQALCSRGLPELRDWILRVQIAAETWRSRDRFGCWRYKGDGVRFEGEWPA